MPPADTRQESPAAASEATDGYPFRRIESSWQQRWRESGAFEARPCTERPKFYCFEYPPYPNSKLHIGHVRNYSIGDATARYRRMRGYNVLYTQGFDAFGLPNDLAAREQNCHPAQWSERCIGVIRTQFDRLGLSYDRRRLVSYHQEDYYRWTQWLFLKFLEQGLAYRGEAAVNWCDGCKTTLADDQLHGGCCWRCHEPTQRRRMTQWFLRTTAFSEPLLANLERLSDWPENIRKIQRHWIGRADGLAVRFAIAGTCGLDVRVFTLHPEILFGMRFVALALDHPLLAELGRRGLLSPAESAAIEALHSRTQAARKSIQQGKKGRQPTAGVVLGIEARHPLTSEAVPIVVANYVDVDFATGAVGGVGTHFRDDWELAVALGLPCRQVLVPPDRGAAAADPFAYDESWKLVNSRAFDGLTVADARERISREVVRAGLGEAATYYRLRDWVISRQRYWGTPIPIVYCPVCGTEPVPEEQLPVRLPREVDLSVVGNPLEFAAAFVPAPCPRCGRVARRETDTMDVFVSCLWFFYRYAVGPRATHPFTDEEAAYWMPGDVAIGGIEHATTTYFQDRFLTHALKSMGLIDYDEPFARLVSHQMVIRDGRKMSKSLGNTIDPDALVERYGADSLRLAILFMASPDKPLEWSEASIRGCHRFLTDVWELVREFAASAGSSRAARQRFPTPPVGELRSLPAAARELLFDLHRITGSVTRAYEDYQFNVAIQSLMRLRRLIRRFVHSAAGDGGAALVGEALSRLVRMLAPAAPHLAEELWQMLGEKDLVFHAPWPESDRTLLAARDRKVVIQLDGAHRGDFAIAPGTSREAVREHGFERLISRAVEEGSAIDPTSIRDWLYVQKKRFDVLNFLTAPRDRKL